ncbi:TM0106 family RecB-like putative nuclease [Legionella pneumophila]|uniref:TM0106 family RecB-like putative nuclease n=1 Tax=Legionella pneumophila TaxID=446 RepID=UPI0024B6EEFC|nr:TM0106 family RecB-like putative nuclease [Legionella pneumophila]MDI9824476.1 TM0106 family RecB-like putative nuclease [Legionella pneumophila]
MYKQAEKIIYSPSDITLFMESPFASWMERFTLHHPDFAGNADAEDIASTSLKAKGIEREKALLKQFEDQDLHIARIDKVKGNKHKAEKTIEAMNQGIDVIYQAALGLDQFHGFADFLVKTKGDNTKTNVCYEIWDTKLSSSIKPTFIIQLCCYAEMLEAIQGVLPEHIIVAMGNNKQERLKTKDFYYYYQAIKQEFILAQERFDANQRPNPADSKSFGRWQNYAEQLLTEQDDLSLVANITRSQIKKLHKAGINTVSDLASTNSRVPGLRQEQFIKLQKQADIQVKSNGQIPPLYELLTPESDLPSGLALLPPPSMLDVFFDIEGYPWLEGGLEYLWGVTYFDEQGDRQFKDFWAHDHQQERLAFKNFIHWVYQRWQQDPAMHIYHYANYEIAACKRLMGRYGICEEEVDQLLRNNVFVDLYKIVKSGLRIGEPRYSIKNVEHLYRGKRDTEVGTGGDSVAVYHAWRENPDGDTWQSSKTLNDIREYNIDDCNSTQELVDWLRAVQQKHQVAYEGNDDIVEVAVKEDVTERTQLRDNLLQQAQAQQGQNADLTENLAWMLEFHRREAKPIFWRKFERLGLSDDELFDDMDCLAGCIRTERAPFKLTARTKKLAYEHQFDPNQEFKGASKAYTVLGHETEEGKELKLTFIDKESGLDKGLIVLQSTKELPGPITLIPDEYINPKPIPTALTNQIKAYSKGLLNKSAVTDFLTRSAPRITTIQQGEPIVSSHEPEVRLQQIIEAVLNLDNSYLPIQGPPGAGKTYTAKHIIAELMKRGYKVGISSNSHKAINHLLISCAMYCHKQGIQAHFVCTSNTDDKLTELGVTITDNKRIVDTLQRSCVIGTTAWGFSREDLKDEFDYLFIDEAGQVSVANLVAMSQSARNIVLLGDQMQLGQPTQGTHPKDSGLSILDYLLKDSPTIQPEMGVFLETTYRMHSRVNQFISEAIYDGQLHADPVNDKQVIAVPEDYHGLLDFEAGIKFIPIEHEGNTQASDEEVVKIKELVQALLGRLFTDKHGKQRAITLDDILFVAPYNHQRNKLQETLGPEAKVGTVDKFQGQEAPIVFFSLCTSDASESPRGIDFLFDKHRINVAISRAQSMVIVVGNRKLFTTPTNNEEQMKKINILAKLIKY